MFSPRPWGWSVMVSTPVRIPPFSPRPWGWSVRHILVGRGNSVFPARVGMVRSDTACSGVAFRYPLARGDGPLDVESSSINRMLSPRPWGWSDQLEIYRTEYDVIPSRVGMVRGLRGGELRCLCFPRARGDGPKRHHKPRLLAPFSPRAWGWSSTSSGSIFE